MAATTKHIYKYHNLNNWLPNHLLEQMEPQRRGGKRHGTTSPLEPPEPLLTAEYILQFSISYETIYLRSGHFK